MDWFQTASSTQACDYISKGIAEFRRLIKVDGEQRKLKKQQIEVASVAGRISAADKAAFDAANHQFEQRNKDNANYDDALVVLAVLGSRLVGLDVVKHNEIKSAHVTVQQAFQGVGGSKFFERFDRQDVSVQIGVTCGFTFCAECFPMHIWRGFGAALLDDYSWAPYTVDNETWTHLDQSVSFLKSSPRNFILFKSVPEGMERMKPWIREDEKLSNAVSWKAAKKERKALEQAKRDFTKRAEKKGFPQPLDNSFSATSWSIPFATWNSPFNISNEGHSWINVLRQQMDPGRLFHAFVIGGHLNLREGEVLIIPAGPAESLVGWLEGLEGMIFKLVPAAKLNFKRLGLKSSTKTVMETMAGKDAYAVRDAVALHRKQAKASAASVSALSDPPPPIVTRTTSKAPVPAGYTTSPQSPASETQASPTMADVASEKPLSTIAQSADAAAVADIATPPPDYAGQDAAVSATSSGPTVDEYPSKTAAGIPPLPLMPDDKRALMPPMSSIAAANGHDEEYVDRRASMAAPVTSNTSPRVMEGVATQ